MTNPLAVVDRLADSLIVADQGTEDVVITIVVNSDPCPSVEWSFAGSELLGDSNYSLSASPCDGAPPFTFSLTIATLTPDNSGQYSAAFNNGLGGITLLPGLVVTVPGNGDILLYSYRILAC